MIHVRLFGTTAVTTAAGSVSAPALGGVKPRQILEILALSAGTPVPKDRLAELLWAGRPPRSYVATLESYVCVLRRALGLAHGRTSGINTVLHGYVLDPDIITVDLSQFRSAVRAATAAGDPGTSLARLQGALALITGELLAGEPYASWAAEERAAVRHEVAAAAGAAADRALALGRPADAVRLARVAIDHEPFAEGSWRVLMGAANTLGRRPEALRAYLDLRVLLADELGTDPTTETTELYLTILSGDAPGPPGRQPASRDEVSVLTRLLRQALAQLEEHEVSPAERAMVRATLELAAAS